MHNVFICEEYDITLDHLLAPEYHLKMKSEGVVNLKLITSFKYHFAKCINFVLLRTSVKMEKWGERVWEVAERKGEGGVAKQRNKRT